MCNFLSALVLRNGDLLHHPMTDSHSDLVRYFRLADKTACRHFAKVELMPPTDKDGRPDYARVGDYALRVDDTEPAWFDEHRNAVDKRMRAIVKAMIVDDDSVPLVLDGCRILIKGAKVEEARGGRILAMTGDAQVGVMRDTSQVGVMRETSKAPRPPTTDKRESKPVTTEAP